ncbi:hypothetical protein GCK32_022607 [Trichostrongylus colubriformis]|uniref:Uncharacterized protein n=1 Tax=Trichostrongylus colubriformis TaxID=6319 RepID=A0AAN8FNU0_TRICO
MANSMSKERKTKLAPLNLSSESPTHVM